MAARIAACRRLAIAVALLLCATCALAAREAHGAASAPSWSRALELFEAGDFPGAIEELAALAAQPGLDARTRGTVLLYLGIGHLIEGREALGREQLARAIEADPELAIDARKHKPSVVALFEGLRQRLVGRIAIASRPSGLPAQVDGRPVGTTPVEVASLRGEHVVRVELDGRASTRRVRVTADTTIGVTLVPPPPRRPARPVAAPRPWAWATLIAGALSLAGAAALTAMAVRDDDSACGLLPDSGGVPCELRRGIDAADLPAYAKLHDRSHREGLAAGILWGAGAALVATSVVLFLRRPAGERTAAARLAPGTIAWAF